MSVSISKEISSLQSISRIIVKKFDKSDLLHQTFIGKHIKLLRRYHMKSLLKLILTEKIRTLYSFMLNVMILEQIWIESRVACPRFIAYFLFL